MFALRYLLIVAVCVSSNKEVSKKFYLVIFNRIDYTVEATYKGRLYKGQLLIRDSLKSTNFFLSLVYKFLPFIRDKNCLKPDMRDRFLPISRVAEW